MEEREHLPSDAPEADAAEQERDWQDEEPAAPDRETPPDAPEADYLDQAREAGLEDDERDRG